MKLTTLMLNNRNQNINAPVTTKTLSPIYLSTLPILQHSPTKLMGFLIPERWTNEEKFYAPVKSKGGGSYYVIELPLEHLEYLDVTIDP